MNREELLDLCARRGIVLGVEADQLKVRAAKGALDESLRQMLLEHKQPLVEWLSANRSRDERRNVPAVQRVAREGPVPASLAQQRLWFMDQLEAGAAAYQVRGAIRLYGVLDREALRRALNTLITRHEALRTTFAHVNGEVQQLIAVDACFALHEADLSGDDVSAREARIADHIAQEATDRFDLSTGPLIRGRLLRVNAEEHVLLLTMHHIASDGWSVGIILNEIRTLYAAYREGRASPLDELPIQFADYAIWQRKWLQGEVLQNQIDYWKQQLAGAPALLELPLDRPRPATQSYRGETVAFTLERELCEQLRFLARQHDVTLFMVVYAALAVVLSRLSAQEDVVIGMPVANRPRVELEGLVGFFVNMLAVRVQVDATESVRELLSRVQEKMLGGYAHQEIPFEQVVEILQPPRSLSHSPVFQVCLIWQNPLQAESREEWLPGLRMKPLPTSTATSKFDLSWALQEVGGEIVGTAQYASDLFDRETMARWVGHFKAALGEMVRDARQPVGELSLLDSAESARVLREFNATATSWPDEKLIHELFEAQVASSPQALAVADGSLQLTYGELNEHANQLAHYLVAQGAGPDRLVTLYIERGVELVVSMLGVLKAGAAYVPIEVGTPAQRVAQLIADAKPVVVITQEKLKGHLPGDAAVLVLDSERQALSEQPKENIDPRAMQLTSSNLAYVLYTSGSTGTPKGVMVEHRNIVNYAVYAADRFDVAAGSGSLISTSLSFDLALTGFYPPL
ncbi:MAG TPA: condensation domain-containing protein, partial [Steroidobacteraceae bacterium]|nr:condensation domain-containing protein [Steroidobacteraceae bacterium]